MNGSFGYFELVGEQRFGLRQYPAEFTEDSSNGSVLESLTLRPEHKGMGVFFGPDGFPVFLQRAIRVNRSSLMAGFCQGLKGNKEFSVLSVP